MASSTQELACIYAALALQDDGVPTITADKIQAIVKAAGVEIEPFWAGLYANALEGVDVKTLISNIGSGAGAAPVSAAAAPAAESAAPAAKEEKKKEEPKEESDEDMGFGLFD